MIARRTKLIKESGPYHVFSRVDGTITIQHKQHIEGCDDCRMGFLSCVKLAREIEKFLNVGTKEKT